MTRPCVSSRAPPSPRSSSSPRAHPTCRLRPSAAPAACSGGARRASSAAGLRGLERSTSIATRSARTSRLLASDANHDGVIDPGEVASLLFYPTEGTGRRRKLTADFDRAWQVIKAASARANATPTTPDEQRRALVTETWTRLATLVASDFRSSMNDDKTLVRHMLTVARLIDDLFATTNGAKRSLRRSPQGTT